MRIFNKGVILGKAVFNIKNWIMCFLEYIGVIKDSEFIVIFRNRIKCLIRTNCPDDRAVIKGVWLNKVYFLWEDDIQDGSVVIDLGAHIGAFSLFAASRARDVKVYAFEPFPQNFSILKQNIGMNKFKDNIKPFELAVSSHKREIQFFVHPTSTVGHTTIENIASLRESEIENREQIIVNAIPLEEIFALNDIESCSLLKMDIEGAEYPVLYNAPKNLFKKIERIYLEYEDIESVNGYNHWCLKKFLKDNGFSVIERKPFLYARSTELDK